ncbi:MAG: glycosyltransferase family 2 protein [Thermoanaerobaculia bacterium]
MSSPALSAIVVHWRGEEDLARLLAAWPDDPSFELVVVNNGPAALGDRPPARILEAGGNLGFAGGSNRGAAAARGDLLLLLNPDALPRAGALAALVDGFAALPDAAGLAPRLVSPEGAPQFRWQLRPLPRLGELLAQAFFLDLVRGPEREPAAGDPVAQPAAAALALRRAAFDAVGGFDPRFHPAWFEDVDLARRLADRRLVVRYWPAAELVHRGGSSVATLGYGAFLSAYTANLARYIAKHHGRGWALLLRALVPAGALARLVALPLRRPRRAASRGEAARGLVALAGAALSGWPAAGRAGGNAA